MISQLLISALKPWPRHPIDAHYGIETSRHFPRFLLRDTEDSNRGYVGAQPSILRHCLDMLPCEGADFFDLGCGKGRMLAVASEYPFADIFGMEIVPGLVRKARTNMRKLKHPVTILNADATKPPIASCPTVLFLYNPFGAEQTARLIEHLRTVTSKLYVVSYNPVHASLFDHSGIFERLYAALLPFAEEERATSPFGNAHDSVVIWQSKSEPMLPPREGADRKVIVTQANWVGEVQMD